MLGDLFRRGRVDDAQVRLDDDVGHSRVGGRSLVGEFVCHELLPGVDVENGAGRFVGVEVGDGFAGVGGLVEEDERNVVACGPLNGHVSRVDDLGWVDFSVDCGIDGRIAVFRGNDDEGIVVEALGFEFVDNRANVGVDRVDSLQKDGGKGEACGILVPAIVDLLTDVDWNE